MPLLLECTLLLTLTLLLHLERPPFAYRQVACGVKTSADVARVVEITILFFGVSKNHPLLLLL